MCRATLGAVPQKPFTTLSLEAGSLWVLLQLDWLADHWTLEIYIPRTAVTGMHHHACLLRCMLAMKLASQSYLGSA